jgi:hypothetical protein
MHKNNFYRLIQAILAWIAAISVAYWLLSRSATVPFANEFALVSISSFVLFAGGFRKAHTKVRRLADEIVYLCEEVTLVDAKKHPLLWNIFKEYAYAFALDLKPRTAGNLITAFDKAYNSAAFLNDSEGETLVHKMNELRELWNNMAASQRYS